LLRLAAAALSLGLAAHGGAAAEDGAKRVRSLVDIRNAQLVRQHWDLSCGAAAVATLLTYQLGEPVSEREAALGMLQRSNPVVVRARMGFSLLDLKRFAASRGAAAAGFAGLSLDELIGMAPAIAPIRSQGFGHFVIVRGRVGDRVLIADPAFGARTLRAEDFRRVWTGGVGFVLFRPDEPHPPNRMAASFDLPVLPSGAALRAADAAVQAHVRTP
jgi:predicted double-glycine peptidase